MRTQKTHELSKIVVLPGGDEGWTYQAFATCDCGRLLTVYVFKGGTEEMANNLLERKYDAHRLGKRES